MKTNPIRNQMHALLGLLLSFTLHTSAQTITWQEDWESPVALDNWYADFGIWEIGVPTYGPPDRGDGWRAHQGTNCAATVLWGNYPVGRTSRLVSSPVLVPLSWVESAVAVLALVEFQQQ